MKYLLALLLACESKHALDPPDATEHRVVVMVWDGLRPDMVNTADTPNLAALAQAGVTFSDHHSTYPTFTMMNAASLATGHFAQGTGFYGNTFWQPGAKGTDASGAAVDFSQPVFSEDYSVLKSLNAFYKNRLLMARTLFGAAQDAGMQTSAVGKSGPAFLQDYNLGGLMVDERAAFPLDFANELKNFGVALPKLTPNGYPANTIALAAENGDPTAATATKFMVDGVTADPTDTGGNPFTKANSYLMDVFTTYTLLREQPKLSFVWLRNPDATEHLYGVNVPNMKDALRAQDAQLGKLLAALRLYRYDTATDVIVVSDHAHSNVSGDFTLFPPREVVNGATALPLTTGYSVSGTVRLADLLTRAGMHAFDGGGCSYDPVMSGVKPDGTLVYPTKTDDGSVCKTPGKPYTTAGFRVPDELPEDAVIVARNGGSDYLYVPSGDGDLVARVVRLLQAREEVGAIFVHPDYGVIPGTLGLDVINVASVAARTPDIVLSFGWDDKASLQGIRGIEYSSQAGLRGMHGSFSPIDVHNTLIAAGPSFKQGWTDPLPSGNVDVAPTLAHILGLSLGGAGRVLSEALRDGPDPSTFTVTPDLLAPDERATDLVMQLPTDPDGKDLDPSKTTYSIELAFKTLIAPGVSVRYFDSAKALRE